MSEKEYITSSKWEQDKQLIHNKINEVDNKHTTNYNNLLNKIEVQTVVQQNTYESQKKSEKHLEEISKSINKVGSKVRNLEYESKDNKKEIARIQNTMDEKSKGNANIIVAWIAVAGGVLPVLINIFANLFK